MRPPYILKNLINDRYSQQTIFLRSLYVFFGGVFNLLYLLLFDLKMDLPADKVDNVIIARSSVFISLTIIALLMNVKKWAKHVQIIIFPAGTIVGLCVVYLMQVSTPVNVFYHAYLPELIVVLCLCPIVGELTPFFTTLQILVLVIVYNLLVVPQLLPGERGEAINGDLLLLICIFYVSLSRVYLQKLTATTKIQKVKIERKRLKEMRKNDELLEMDAFKTKLLSILSHDVRNPLTNVQALIALKEHLTSGEERLHYDQKIKESVDQTLQLLNDLLNWSSAQIKGVRINITPIDLYSLSNDVLKLFSASAEHKGLLLKNDVPEDLVIHTDHSIVQLLLRNLVSNGIKFTRMGHVRISCNTRKDGVEICVTDTGRGIHEDVLSLHPSQIKSSFGTNNEKGIGFGLILCKEYLSKINGQLSYTSKLNEGTTFFVFIPAHYKRSDLHIPVSPIYAA